MESKIPCGENGLPIDVLVSPVEFLAHRGCGGTIDEYRSRETDEHGFLLYFAMKCTFCNSEVDDTEVIHRSAEPKN